MENDATTPPPKPKRTMEELATAPDVSEKVRRFYRGQLAGIAEMHRRRVAAAEATLARVDGVRGEHGDSDTQAQR